MNSSNTHANPQPTTEQALTHENLLLNSNDRENNSTAVFDFDGTISVIRSGWADCMIPMMVEHLLNLKTGEVRNENPITSQTPAGGANVPRGSLVILYVD